MVGSLGVRVAGPSVSTLWRAKRGSGDSGLVTRVLTQNQKSTSSLQRERNGGQGSSRTTRNPDR